MSDAALKRKNMVESQVRTSDVTDRRITAAMQAIAREDFVPDDLKDLAYIDDPLTVAPGRSLMAPRTFARLLQLATVQDGDKVLIVGGLAGYSTAVMARLAGEVVMLESDAALAGKAKAAVEALGIKSATVVSGPLAAGWAPAAPFDVIFMEGGSEVFPDALLRQLKDSGRLVCVDLAGGVGRAVLLQRIEGQGEQSFSRRTAFEANASCLPGFARAPAFVF